MSMKRALKHGARRITDRLARPYVDRIETVVRSAEAQVLSSLGSPDESPDRSPVARDRFHASMHELRTLEMNDLPKCGRRVLSVGVQGPWYFDWVRGAYGDVDIHVALGELQSKLDELPGYARWVANRPHEMGDVEDGSIDLLLGGQTIERLWADELESFLLEAHRVVRPGGVLTVDGANRLVTEQVAWSNGAHTIELSPDEILTLLELAGFDVFDVHGLWNSVVDGEVQQPEGGLDDSAVFVRRALSARTEPDRCFGWWINCRRADREPKREEMAKFVGQLFGSHWLTRVSRGFFVGPGKSLELEAGGAGRLAVTLPFMVRAGSWRAKLRLSRGSWSDLDRPRLILEQPGHHELFSCDLTGSEPALAFRLRTDHEALSFALVADCVRRPVTVEFPIDLAPSDVLGMRHGMTVEEFAEAYDAGALAFESSTQFSVAFEDEPWRDLDPHSAEYRAWVLSSWQAISGRAHYEPQVDEVFDASTETFLARPYPFSTGDGTEVGNYMGAVAWLLRTIRPRAGQRVVELGSGWGHLAINLAMLGCETTAVDLNPSSVHLLRARARAWNVELDVIQTAFLEFEPAGLFDFVIFFEAFHHCDRPLELLDRVASMLTADGSAIFLGEPVYDGYYCPWGVRTDGSATFMTRYAGWLELGFDRKFFDDELRQRGLQVSVHWEPSLAAYGHMIVASRV